MAVNLTVSFSEKSELNRVTDSIKHLPWFREQKYPETFAKLPLEVTESSSEDAIVTAIAKEYDAQIFMQTEENIRSRWITVADGFENLRKIPGIELRDSYAVVLTKYGSGGSYDGATGTLIIRTGSPKRQEQIIGVIVHEIVHMTIQHLIDHYRVRHWRKERLVDLLVERFFPRLRPMQIIQEDISAVDFAFSELFPDMLAITRSIGEISS